MSSATSAFEFSTIFDQTTCVRKGVCHVSSIRHKGDSLDGHTLYYEQHGTGPEKIILIMGLNSTSFYWKYQVEYFAKLPMYSVLVFDNRGVGNSSAPRGPYSTSGMAEDTIALLNYVGWTDSRILHIVGVSLGGMIAQEIASRIPDQILSLTLAVSSAGGRPWTNLAPWRGSLSLLVLPFLPSAEARARLMLERVYPKRWLDAIAEDDAEGRTNLELVMQDSRRRVALVKPQTLMGALSQMVAGLTHHVTPSQLREISKNIPKVVIMAGDFDDLVHLHKSYYMRDYMPEAEFIQWENTGHGIHMQYPKRFCQELERIFAEARARAIDLSAT